MKNRITKGAAKLFFKHGYSGVRVDDIAEFVGISKKTIYNHFPNKLALIQAVVEINVLELCKRLDELASEDSEDLNSIDKIHRLMLFGFQEIASSSWIFTADKKNKHAQDLIQDAIELIRNKIIELVGEYLDKAITDNMIRKDVSKDILPYIVVILVEGIFQLHRFSEIKVRGDELFKESMKMIYEGILTPKGKKAFRSKW